MDAKLGINELIVKLSAGRTTGFIERLSIVLRERHFELNDLIDITFHPDKQIAFRAAWLMDTAILAQPDLYVDNLEYLIGRIKEVTNESCKRHYTRILLNLTDPKAPPVIKLKLLEIDMEDVVEQLFDWVIDPKVKVAVKVFAADTLYNLSDRYNWINDELANQVEFMMRDGSAAIQSRGRKLLASIQK